MYSTARSLADFILSKWLLWTDMGRTPAEGPTAPRGAGGPERGSGVREKGRRGSARLKLLEHSSMEGLGIDEEKPILTSVGGSVPVSGPAGRSFYQQIRGFPFSLPAPPAQITHPWPHSGCAEAHAEHFSKSLLNGEQGSILTFPHDGNLGFSGFFEP